MANNIANTLAYILYIFFKYFIIIYYFYIYSKNTCRIQGGMIDTILSIVHICACTTAPTFMKSV